MKQRLVEFIFGKRAEGEKLKEPTKKPVREINIKEFNQWSLTMYNTCNKKKSLL